jgi:hypothetical protein
MYRDSSIGRASDSDSEGWGTVASSRCHLFVLVCSRRSTGQDTSLRTKRLGGSNPSASTIFSGPSSNGKGAVLRRLKFRFDSGRIGQEPVADGDATDCLSVPCGFESRSARQISRGSGQAPILWGSGQDGLSHRSFTARIAGSNPAYPAMLFRGSKVAMRLAVNQDISRFESCPRSESYPGEVYGERPLLLYGLEARTTILAGGRAA